MKRTVQTTAAILTLAAFSGLPARAATSAAAPGDDGAKIHELNAKALNEVSLADKSLRSAGENHVQLQRIVQRLGELTNQIKSNNQAVAGLQKLQPTATLASLDKATAGAKGSGDQPWFPGDSSPIPSLAMVQKSVDDLQQQIQKAQADKAELEKQRTAAAGEAEKYSHQADALTGKPGLDAFTQAAGQRKTAADLTTQLDTVDSKLMLLNQDLQVAQAQQKAIEAAVARLGELTRQTNSGWDSIQKQIQAYTDLSRNVMQAASSPATQPAGELPPNTVADAVDRLNALTEATVKARNDAEAHLTAALSNYNQAATATRGLTKAYADNVHTRATDAQLPAWNATLDVFTLAGPTLQKAEVELQQAQLQAAAAYEAASRGAVLKDLKDALDQAKLSLPGVSSEAVSAPEGDKNAAVEKARAAFEAADKDLDGAMTGTGTVRDIAKLAKIYEEYSYALLLRFTQNSDLATQKLEDARTRVTEALATPAASSLPAFPAEISPAPSKPEAAPPTTAPSGDVAAPASQPADAAPAK